MDKDKRSLRLELEKDPDLDKAWRTRRIIRGILAIIAALLILAEVAVQYFIRLHK